MMLTRAKTRFGLLAAGAALILSLTLAALSPTAEPKTERESPITTLRTPRPPSVGAGPSFSATSTAEISTPEVSEVATTVTSALEVETPAPEIVTPVATAAVPSGAEAPSLPPAAPTEVVRSSSQSPAAGLEAEVWASVMAHFPEWEWFKAMAVADCETGGTFNPELVGGAGEQGVFQVIARFHGAVPSDIDGQVAQAARIQRAQGWQPWSCA